MKRNTVAIAAGIAVALGTATVVTAEAGFATTNLTTMLQGQVASRWQPERFGPIVSSDTLWSIAMYYSDRTDLTVYEMMDLIVEINPKVFINGRADRMMDGYYLKIPPQAQQAMVAAKLAEAEALAKSAPQPIEVAAPATSTEPSSEAVAEETAEPASEVEVSSSVQFDVNELQQLRRQLAESITLIERLNTENGELQQRLNDVSADLNELKLKVNAEQQAEAELKERIAAEISAVKTEPTTTSSASETQVPVENKPAAPSALERFLNWLMQPFQLALAILIPLLLAAVTWYLLYVRRLNKAQVGPYNGARKASEKEKQQLDEETSEEKPLSAFEEAELAAAAEADVAVMPDYTEQPAEPIRLEESDQVVFVEPGDEPVVQTEDEDEVELEPELESEPESELEPNATDELADLEFSLTEAASEASTSPVEASPEVATSDDSAALDETDFSLDFDTELDELSAETDAEAATDDKANETAEFDLGAEIDNLDDFDLDDIDLDESDATETETAADGDINTETDTDADAPDDEPQADDGHYLEIEALLQEAEAAESDFDNPPFDREAGAIDDDAETPAGIIDLARAYMEMNEFELARAELDKLNQFADEDAQREGAMLLQQIDEQKD